MHFKILSSEIQLYCGDCLEELKKIPPNSVHLVAVDPPYGTTQNKWDTIIPFEPLWPELERVLVSCGVVVFTAVQPFTSQLIMSNPSWYKYDLVWEKTVGSGQLNIKHRPLRTHEDIVVFYNKLGTYNEQLTLGSPYKIYRLGEEFGGNYGNQRDHTKINDGFRHAKSIIKIPNPRIEGGHPTQKPIALFDYIIRTYSNEGDTVLDYCMGSGTTGEACIDLKRNFIGIESDEEWFARSDLRLKNVQMKLF